MEFGVLGPLRVTDDGAEIDIRAPKLRTLLALLLVHRGSPVSLSAIVDALWGEVPGQAAEATVYVYVSRLRRILGPSVLTTAPAGYALVVEPEAMDAEQFEFLAARGRRELGAGKPGNAAKILSPALALWRGPAFREFRGQVWADGAAARLDELYLTALEDRIDADLACGRAAELVPELDLLVAESPLREHLCSQLMLALYRSGRQAEALRAYAALRERLGEQLGIFPSRPLQQLEQAVLLQTPELDLPAADPGCADRAGPTRGTKTAPGHPADQPQLMTVLCCRVTSPDESTRKQALEDACSRIARFDGHVLAVQGAQLTAVFGYTGTQEDHATRAAASACAVRDAVATSRGARTACGLHSGPVVLAHEAADQATARVAEQLATGAPLGAIHLSAPSAHLLRRDARLEPVRTDTAPLSGVCRLVGLATDAPGEAFRFASLSPFVGRRIEVSRLLELLAETESGHGQTVGITGEPGMGKSRLLYELRARQEVAAARWIEGRALSYAGNIPYFVVGRLIASACGLRTGDDPMVAERRVAQTVERAGGPPEWTAILLRVLNRRAEEAGAGLDPAARKTRIIDVIRRFLWRLARQRTLVIAVEDLHWSDPTSEEVLAALAESIVDAHVLLVCTHRPGYRPPWAARSYSSQLTLRPLGAVDGRAVMQSAAGTDLDDALAHQILSRADGNPFFVEELTRVVVEGGGVTVPETLTGVLAAAIAALDDEPRRLLQAASVLGRSFPSRLLPLISSGSTPYDAVAAELRRRELLYESDAGDEAHHVFRHVLTQEVAYSSLSSQARRELHSAAAAAFEQCWSDRLEQVEHELARHHARSGDPARAVHWLTRVARTAAAQYAHHEALSALEEAAAHAANLPARERSRVRVELLLAQANSLFLLGLLPEVVARFTADQQSLDELDDPALTGPWHFVLAHAHCLLGHRRETATHAAIAIRAATLADDRDTLGKTHYVLGVDGMWSSQLQAGAEHGRTAVALLDTSPELYWRGMSHWVTAINLGMGGHFPAALEGVERCHADAEACGDPRVMAYATWTHAFVLMFIGQEQRAVDQARRAVERARDPYTHHACRCVLGWAYLTAGDASRAVQELEAGTSWMVGAAFERAAALFGSAFAAALLAAGEDARAVVLATRCLDIMNRTGCGYAAGLAQRTLARAARRRGDPSAAAMLSETAQTFAAIDSIFEEAVTREELAEMALAEGDETAAQDEFRRAVGLLEGTGALCHLERVRTRLQSLRSD